MDGVHGPIEEGLLAAPTGGGFSTPWWEIIGLAGAGWGLAEIGEDFDPTAGAYASADSRRDLVKALVALQSPGGDFAFSSMDAPDGESRG